MTLRDRLAGVLREHSQRGAANWETKIVCACGAGNFANKKEHSEHVADVLLSLPGIAVVELPEPENDNFYYGRNYVFVDDGEVTGKHGTEFGPPKQVQQFAAALLAAASRIVKEG